MARGKKRSTPSGAGAQPVTTAPSAQYGQAQQLADAQAAVPLPDRTAPAGSFGPLTGPSERPSEPITAGAPFGPGPGPEALPGAPDQFHDEIDPLIFARFLPALELMASRPDSSQALRAITRTLRAKLPANFDPTEHI